MSSSRRIRVERGQPPKKPIKRHKYRDALPELLRDFEERCAYSMQHQSRSGPLKVDHFDPRKKEDFLQDYDNLFPVSRYCNGKKSDRWPTKGERTAGCRFLNPCKEIDYGVQIFEDPSSHMRDSAGTWTNPVLRLRISRKPTLYVVAFRAGMWFLNSSRIMGHRFCRLSAVN